MGVVRISTHARTGIYRPYHIVSGSTAFLVYKYPCVRKDVGVLFWTIQMIMVFKPNLNQTNAFLYLYNLHVVPFCPW